jgi:hypothetical protein
LRASDAEITYLRLTSSRVLVSVCMHHAVASLYR